MQKDIKNVMARYDDFQSKAYNLTDKNNSGTG